MSEDQLSGVFMSARRFAFYALGLGLAVAAGLAGTFGCRRRIALDHRGRRQQVHQGKADPGAFDVAGPFQLGGEINDRVESAGLRGRWKSSDGYPVADLGLWREAFGPHPRIQPGTETIGQEQDAARQRHTSIGRLLEDAGACRGVAEG